jgi:hypothetical protein
MPDDRSKNPANREKESAEKIPLGQVLLDDIFFLLALGLGIPFILYTLWGVIEVFMVPHA